MEPQGLGDLGYNFVTPEIHATTFICNVLLSGASYMELPMLRCDGQVYKSIDGWTGLNVEIVI